MNLRHLLLLVLTLGFWSPWAAANAPERLILQGADPDRVAQAVSQAGGQVLRQAHFYDAVIAHVPEAARRGLQQRLPQLKISPDIRVYASAPGGEKGPPDKNKDNNDDPSPPPAQETPWGVTMINATAVHAGNKGAGTTVCVVDTGVDQDHPDLQANRAFLAPGVERVANWIAAGERPYRFIHMPDNGDALALTALWHGMLAERLPGLAPLALARQVKQPGLF